MVGTFLWNFIKIRLVVSEKKMFKEKVNGRTDARTMDNGPWHKLTGLWPVELKIDLKIKICFEMDRNIVPKRENAGYHHFLLFPQFFRWLLFQGC